MAVKRRAKQYTMAAATGSTEIGLGTPYARILRLEIKGDDGNVDDTTTLELIDGEGRLILTAFDIGDAGRDDSTTKRTSQTFSTVGEAYALVNDEALSLLSSGAVGTDNVGGGPVVAKSPVTVNFAAGTSGDVFEVALYVDGSWS